MYEKLRNKISKLQVKSCIIHIDSNSVNKNKVDKIRRILDKNGNYMILVPSLISQLYDIKINKQKVNEKLYYNHINQLQKLNHKFIVIPEKKDPVFTSIINRCKKSNIFFVNTSITKFILNFIKL